MSDNNSGILPYTKIVGQENIKLALELTYVAPRIGGVLLSGHRGTGKSTAVRSFAIMMHDSLPVTLPINATEDRVVGGWKIDELMQGKPVNQPGLLEEASGKLLYVDEINLLDDHIINIILDVTSTGILEIQREGQSATQKIDFTLVGTMNPEEGELRPQLLDRFGLMVNVIGEVDPNRRKEILKTVLEFDQARAQTNKPSKFIKDGQEQDNLFCQKLVQAKDNIYQVEVSDKMVKLCVNVAQEFQAVGHRGDYVLALAARAFSAINKESKVLPKHIGRVASLALQHRRMTHEPWTEKDDQKINDILNNA